MTLTPGLLGPPYDAPAKLPASLYYYEAKRSIVLGALQRFEAAADPVSVRLAYWELGLHDLIITPADGNSPYGGAPYEAYAAHYRLTADTVAYAEERAKETGDIVLELHYLEFVFLRSEQRGKEWIRRQQQLLTVYRRYIDRCRTDAANDPEAFAGVFIDRALTRVSTLLSRQGVLKPNEQKEWTEWLVNLADSSRSFPVRDPIEREFMRHRWVAPYLAHLAVIPADAVSEALRLRTLTLVADALAFYQTRHIADDFVRKTAEIDAILRKHWGQQGTHERKVRTHFDALVLRADLHASRGEGILAAHFYREALRLAETERQYYTADQVSKLRVSEQSALKKAITGGEFNAIAMPIEIPKDLMDYTRDTAGATMTALLERVTASVPDRASLTTRVLEANAEAPLQALVGRTVITTSKVVGESGTTAGNVALDVEQRAILDARLLGAAVATTIIGAAATVGLTPDDLIVPIMPLALDQDTITILHRGCERLIAEDFVSATHILVPHIEDSLRQHLRSLGVDTTDFRRDVGDGTSRTDDATLATFMRRPLPDGRTVKEYLGSDLWDHIDSVLDSQTGFNLRNDFAHGLARLGQCSADMAGLALSLLYQLSAAAARP
jgi:hypothetical protein